MSSKAKAEVKTEPVTQTEEVKTEAPVKETKQEQKENIVYLGPTITGVARHSEVFEDGVLPDKAQKSIAEFPMMERLFVKISEMPEAVKELRKEQSVLSTIYKQTENKYQTRR